MNHTSCKDAGKAWDKQNPDTKEKYVLGILELPGDRKVEVFIYENKKKYSDKQPDYLVAVYKECAAENRFDVIQGIKDRYVRIGSAWNKRGKRGGYASLVLGISGKEYYLTLFKVRSEDSVVGADYVFSIKRSDWEFLESVYAERGIVPAEKKKTVKKQDHYSRTVKKYAYRHLLKRYFSGKSVKSAKTAQRYRNSRLAERIDKASDKIMAVFVGTIMIVSVPSYILYNAVKKHIDYRKTQLEFTEYLDRSNRAYESLSDEQKKIESIRKKYEMKYTRVFHVTDGDTVVLTDRTAVRYIGIDTPELAHTPGERTEIGAREAADENEELVLNKKILLLIPWEREYSYDRLLAYVYAPVEDEKGSYYVNVSRYLLEKSLGDTRYGSPDPELPDEIRDLEYLSGIIKRQGE
ncbi:MAG: thermonuclease family protein [Elusimicrobiota bacterium]